MEGFGLFKFFLVKGKECSTDHSSMPLNSSSSLEKRCGEVILLLRLMTEIPEIEMLSLTTDCESDRSSLESSAINARLSSFSED